MNTDSILDTTKKLLGFDSDYTAFDLDIITHINSVFFTLQDLGVGVTTQGFSIVDNTSTWSEFIGEESINTVKSYMFLRIRLLFDPPTSSFALESLKKQSEEMEWRLHVYFENLRATQMADTSGVTVWTVSGGTVPDESQDGDLILDPVTGDLWRDV